MGAIGHILFQHQQVAVEIGLRDQGDEFLLGGGPPVCALSTSVAPEP
jgi:hypothetical protein